MLNNAEVVEGLARLKRQSGVRIGLTLSGEEQGETLRLAEVVPTHSPHDDMKPTAFFVRQFSKPCCQPVSDLALHNQFQPVFVTG